MFFGGADAPSQVRRRRDRRTKEGEIKRQGWFNRCQHLAYEILVLSETRDLASLQRLSSEIVARRDDVGGKWKDRAMSMANAIEDHDIDLAEWIAWGTYQGPDAVPTPPHCQLLTSAFLNTDDVEPWVEELTVDEEPWVEVNVDNDDEDDDLVDLGDFGEFDE